MVPYLFRFYKGGKRGLDCRNTALRKDSRNRRGGNAKSGINLEPNQNGNRLS
jgi:hypothetical protein